VVQSWDPSRPSSSSSTTVSQDTTGVPGAAGTDHDFGAALADNQIFKYTTGADDDYLFVGAPGDRSGAGSVTMLRLPSSGPVLRNAVALAGAGPAGARFGSAIGLSGDDRVLVGAPDAGGGRVFTYRLTSATSGAPVLGTSWGRSAGAGTGYGTSLAGPFVDV
jgi:hypothetical protein